MSGFTGQGAGETGNPPVRWGDPSQHAACEAEAAHLRAQLDHASGLAFAFGQSAVARWRKLAEVRSLALSLGDRSGEPLDPGLSRADAGRASDRRLMEPLRRMLLAIVDRPEPAAGETAGLVVVSRADLASVLSAACLPVRPAAPGSPVDVAIDRLAAAAGVR